MTRNHARPRLADPGTLLATTHQVGGDLRVRLRLARPSDRRRLGAFLDGLSADTLQRRFLAALAVVPDALVSHFTFFDPRERLVIVAAIPHLGDEIVGLADVALSDAGVGELAVVVDDRRHDLGVGKLLTEVVAALAMHQGATRLRAELPERDPTMLHLMQRLGRTAVTVEDGVTIAYTRLPISRRRAA